MLQLACAVEKLEWSEARAVLRLVEPASSGGAAWSGVRPAAGQATGLGASGLFERVGGRVNWAWGVRRWCGSGAIGGSVGKAASGERQQRRGGGGAASSSAWVAGGGGSCWWLLELGMEMAQVARVGGGSSAGRALGWGARW
jgi:hypothetical protein